MRVYGADPTSGGLRGQSMHLRRLQRSLTSHLRCVTIFISTCQSFLLTPGHGTMTCNPSVGLAGRLLADDACLHHCCRNRAVQAKGPAESHRPMSTHWYIGASYHMCRLDCCRCRFPSLDLCQGSIANGCCVHCMCAVHSAHWLLVHPEINGISCPTADAIPIFT